MSIHQLQFTALIDGTLETIIDLIADMPNYGRFLPGSEAFGDTTKVSPYPVRLGTSYLDGTIGPEGGSVTGFERPKHIAFHQTMPLTARAAYRKY